MSKIFYLDTSIWLDFFENRNELNIPKGTWAQDLIDKIIREDYSIIYSDINLIELRCVGYSEDELNTLFKPLKPIVLFIESTNKQIGKAKDLALKRNVPKGDA